MPSFTLRNERYRDEILKFSYPFDEKSSLESSGVYIGTDLLIDASLYFKGGEEMPVHISRVDGTVEGAENIRLVLSDDNGKIVASAVLNYSSETAQVLDNNGVDVGVLVFNLPGLRRFIGQYTGVSVQLLSNVARFSLDVCSTSETKHLRYFIVGEQAVFGDVNLIARDNVVWDDGSPSAMSLTMLGDAPAAVSANNVISINGVKSTAYWLIHHPRLNLRITVSDTGLVFSKVGDLT